MCIGSTAQRPHGTSCTVHVLPPLPTSPKSFASYSLQPTAYSPRPTGYQAVDQIRPDVRAGRSSDSLFLPFPPSLPPSLLPSSSSFQRNRQLTIRQTFSFRKMEQEPAQQEDCSLVNLPIELLEQIVSNLPPLQIVKFRQVRSPFIQLCL